MAYAIKYTIQFQSLHGIDYTVNILVDGFSGTSQRLRAAANPFIVDEDNKDNYFESIRTKSGYIRIVNEPTDLDGNPFDYKDLIATNAQSHQVQLMAANSIIWIGYIKPVVLTSTLFGYRNTIEIPIQCPLAVLKSTPLSFDTTTGTFLTMGQIIHLLFSKLQNITWGHLYLTANIYHSDGDGYSWPFPDLNAAVSMFNFSGNINPTMAAGSTFDNYSATWEDDTPCADILGEICKFWGWTMYTRGTDIYLINPGTVHDYYQIDFDDLAAQLQNGSSETGEAPINLEDLSYKSTKHTEEFLQGYRKITIEADSNADELVFDPMLNDLEYIVNPSVVEYKNTPLPLPNKQVTECLQVWLQNPEANKRLFLHNCRLFINHPDYPSYDYIVVVGYYDQWQGPLSHDTSDLQKMPVKNSFDMKQFTAIYMRPGTEPATPTTTAELEAQTYLAMKTLNDVVIPAESQLCLYGGVKLGLNPYVEQKPEVTDYVRMYLRIGDYWWGGMNVGWTTTMCTFKVYFNDKEEFLTTRAVYSANTLSALYPHAKGYVIPVGSQTRKGFMEIGFLNYPHYREGDSIPHDYDIINFDVRCFSKDYTPQPVNKAKQTYEGVASTMFENDLSVELSMASGTHNLFGKGQIYGGRNGDMFAGCKYVGQGAGLILPENYLLMNMQRVYGQIRHRMKIDVAESSLHANPLTRFAYNNKTYIMQSAKHDYANDKMTLTLIEE